MSNINSLIDGSGYFYHTSENAGTVAVAEFYDSATNTGEITDNAVFNDNAANHGDVAVAVFDGNSQNTGTVDNAVFLGTALNAGTVTVSATFQGGSSNTGTVAAATFQDTASNDGGTVTGNAVFEGTSTNDGGTVGGDAYFAATATNNGTVNGNVTNEGSNPSAGTIISSNNVNYININGNQYANGTYDVIADGNGGSYTNFTYLTEFSEIGSDQTYKYISNGNGTYTSVYINGYVISSVPNYITINSSQFQNGTVDTVADGNGGTSEVTNYLANGVIIGNNISYTERNVNNYTGFDFANGTVDYVSDGIGGYTESDRDYPEAGTVLGTYGGYAYVANGTGGWNTYLEAGTIISSNNQNYINLSMGQYANGTYDVIADGNGGSYNGNYTYAMQGDVFTTGVNAGTIYTPAGAYNYNINYISDGLGGVTEAHLYPAADTYLNEDESYTYTSNAAGGYNSVPKE